MERNLKKTLIRILCMLLAALFATVAVMFYGTMRSIFLQQMSQANMTLVRQIAASFELVASQIESQIYKFASYDDGLLRSVQNRTQSVSAMIDLYETLDSAAMGNQYIYSIYLYLPQEDRIFASDRGSSYKMEKFFDQAVLENLESNYNSIVRARAVPTSTGQTKVLTSIVFPLVGTGGQPSCILIANIDLDLLYQDILQNIQVSENRSVYLYDEDGIIVACRNSSELFTPIEDVRTRDMNDSLSYWISAAFLHHAIMQSEASSPELNLNFYLCTDIPIQLENFSSLPVWIAGFLILVAMGILLCYFVIRASTRPLHDVVFAFNEKILRDLLLDTSHGQSSALQQLEKLDQKFEYERFLVALCETPGSNPELSSLAQSIAQEISGDGKKRLAVRTIAIRPGVSAIIINYTSEQAQKQLPSFFQQIYQKLSGRCPGVWIYAGAPRNSATQLSAAWQDCLSLQGHKLTLQDHLSIFQEPPSAAPLQYPFELEKQLLNNLLVGNDEGCSVLEEKFFDLILDPQSGLSDIQIKNYVYQLQNAILKRMSSLPIALRLSDSAALDGIQTGSDLREWFSTFLSTALEEINKKNMQNENILLQNILQYIDENFLSEDFNLNSISYHFNLNRNYLARMIKEQSGYTFNDYINQKKVELAKRLLSDRSLTVESVAHQCGFTYAHYFIKIFKNLEGVTPGQYRETLEDNTNA